MVFIYLTASQLERPLIHEERETFSNLHYARRTHYLVHDRSRLDRMLIVPVEFGLRSDYCD